MPFSLDKHGRSCDSGVMFDGECCFGLGPQIGRLVVRDVDSRTTNSSRR